jgi:hypothetical protein
MFNVLIDTSVWFDLAQDQKQTPLIEPLITMLSHGYMNLLVPRIVLTEFQKNRGRVAERAQRSLSTHFNLVKDAIRKIDGDSKQKDKVLEYLSDVDHRIPLVGGAATGTLDRIETLLKAVTPIETSDDIKLRATDRALNRKAPCHHENKNAMADAVLIETYFECVGKGKKGERFAFVTHNKHDFSDMANNQKAVHPDLESGFSKIKSLYFVTLADCVRRIDPVLVQEVVWENSYEQEVRSLSEILEAVDRLTTQVWYNRHKYLAYQIERGKHKLVTRAEWDTNWQTTKGYGQTHTIDSVWKGALKSAKKAERNLGKGNYGPWTDFEWGMINGKLSALRWALGDEWDMLDT